MRIIIYIYMIVNYPIRSLQQLLNKSLNCKCQHICTRLLKCIN